MTPCEQFPVDEFWGKRLPLDRSHWRLCTPHWRPVDRGQRVPEFAYTSFGRFRFVFGWRIHGAVCHAGKARARCRNSRNAAPAGWLPQENLCR